MVEKKTAKVRVIAKTGGMIFEGQDNVWHNVIKDLESMAVEKIKKGCEIEYTKDDNGKIDYFEVTKEPDPNQFQGKNKNWGYRPDREAYEKEKAVETRMHALNQAAAMCNNDKIKKEEVLQIAKGFETFMNSGNISQG